MLSENLAPLRLVRVRGALVLRARGRAVSFQRSRMVRQPAVNRSLGGSIPPAGALAHPAEALHATETLVRLQPDARWASVVQRQDARRSIEQRLLHSGEKLYGACSARAARSPHAQHACVRAHASRWSSTRIVSGVNPVRLRAWALRFVHPNRPYTQDMSVRIRPPRPTLRRLDPLGVAQW
jgi:hypothetical protein